MTRLPVLRCSGSLDNTRRRQLSRATGVNKDGGRGLSACISMYIGLGAR